MEYYCNGGFFIWKYEEWNIIFFFYYFVLKILIIVFIVIENYNDRIVLYVYLNEIGSIY